VVLVSALAAMALERDIIIVTGTPGMGKSRWTRQFLRTLTKPRVLIMDTMIEHDGILFDDMGELIEHIERYPTFRVRTQSVPDFELLCKIAYAAGLCWFAIEETQRILPSSRMELPPAFLDIIYRGRHRRVNLLMVSQRPSTVHIAARAMWNRIISFRQTEPADVSWLTNVTGFDLDPLTLPQSYYYDITPTGYQKKVLDDIRKSDSILDDEAETVPIGQQGEGEQ